MEIIKGLECVFCGKEQVVETDCGDLECLECKKVYEKGTTKEDVKKIRAENAKWEMDFFNRFLGCRRRR